MAMSQLCNKATMKPNEKDRQITVSKDDFLKEVKQAEHKLLGGQEAINPIKS